MMMSQTLQTNIKILHRIKRLEFQITEIIFLYGLARFDAINFDSELLWLTKAFVVAMFSEQYILASSL